MSPIYLIVILIVVGVLLQLIKEYVEPKLYLTALVIIILVVVLLLLNMLGVGPHLRGL